MNGERKRTFMLYKSQQQHIHHSSLLIPFYCTSKRNNLVLFVSLILYILLIKRHSVKVIKLL